jgi:hypothetical protein
MSNTKKGDGLLSVLFLFGVVLVFRFWVLYTVSWPWPWLESAVRWIGNTGLVLVGLAMIVSLVGWGVDSRKRRTAEEEAAEKRVEAAHQGRRKLREVVRAFAVLMETEYAFVLRMPLELQKARALEWYDRIVDGWKKENEAFAAMVGNDDYPAVVAELGPVIPRMIEIWQRRTNLYSYAAHWSDPVQRAAEGLRIGRRIEQLKVRERQAQQKFAAAVTKAPTALPAALPWDRPIPAQRPGPRAVPRPAARKAKEAAS